MPPAQNIAERAQAAAAASRSVSGESETLLGHYITPGMSGGSVETVNGATSFTAGIACQKTAKLLEILVQPASTGDLGTVTIARDTDFDGAFDSNLKLPMPVSGLCSNGIISCTAGTWTDCKDYRWDVDTVGALRLTQVDMPALAGCACINNSCGSNLAWANMPTILGTLGGGVVGALTTADPRIGVAQAQINGPVIDYVGAQSTACANSPALDQTRYRAQPATIQGAAQAASTNAVFQAVVASPAGAGKAVATRACTIDRQVNVESQDFDDIVSVTGSFVRVNDCGAGCRLYRLGGTGRCIFPPPTFSAHFTANKPDRLVSAKLVDIQTADWLQARIDKVAVASAGPHGWLTDTIPGDCATGDTFSTSPDIDFTDQLRSGTATVDARVYTHGSRNSGTVGIQIQVDTSCRTSEQIQDLCQGYASDSHCTLRGETVDGVDTVVQGVVTGLTPLPQTRLFGTSACTVQLNRPFFERDRRYRCEIDSSAQPAPDLSRGAYIIDHSTETLLADQQTAADGTKTLTSTPFALPDRGSVPACESICKTQLATVNTAAAPAGVVGTQQNDPAGITAFYHMCLTGGVCQAGPGEQIVDPCGCLDSFPDAAVMMQTVRLAGADLVCTTATPQ